MLKSWSADVVLCTDGPAGLHAEEAGRLDRLGIPVYQQKIAKVEGAAELEQIVFRDGRSLPRQAIFLNTGQSQRCDLAASLGCAFTKNGAVRTGKLEGTNIPGLFVAGDASRDLQLAVVAAAEGAKAAIAIHTSLQEEDAR
jgi:thioredoxin reductase